MCSDIAADIARYIPPRRRAKGISLCQATATLIAENELWLIVLYRIGNWIHRRVRNRILKGLLKAPYQLLCRPVNFLHDTHISVEAEIGPGLYLGHYGGIWVGPATMGRNCNISHGVTIGLGGKGETRGVPTLGDNVYIAPGAKLFGRIVIGSNAAVGANSVVSKSVPEMAVVVGNPGRIVGTGGSADYIEVGALR